MSLTIVHMIIHRWQTYTYFKLFNCYIYVSTMLSSGAAVHNYLWIVYIVHLAIKLFYPIKSSKIFNSDYSRKFFIAEVIIVFVIGSVPSLLIATVGPDYEIVTFPPLFCGSGGVCSVEVVEYLFCIDVSKFDCCIYQSYFDSTDIIQTTYAVSVMVIFCWRNILWIALYSNVQYSLLLYLPLIHILYILIVLLVH